MMQTPESINIIGDTHNIDSLKIVLENFNNIISLGDITASPKYGLDAELLAKYRLIWKKLSSKEPIDILETEWFRKITLEPWAEQTRNIVDSGKTFALIPGNSDIAVSSFFPDEINQYSTYSDNFEYTSKPTLKIINNVQLILLPFQREKYDLINILPILDSAKKLFILTHCPPLKNASKQYYVNMFNVVSEIALQYSGQITLFHGHMHPENSFTYTLKELENVKCFCPKAEDTPQGFGVNNHIIHMNTITGEFILIDAKTKDEKQFEPLPQKYFSEEEHWNEYKKQEINQSKE